MNYTDSRIVDLEKQVVELKRKILLLEGRNKDIDVTIDIFRKTIKAMIDTSAINSERLKLLTNFVLPSKKVNNE